MITNTTGPTSPVLLGEPFQLTCSANSTTANFVKRGSSTKLGDSHSVQNSSMKDAGTYNCEASSSCKDRSFVVVEVYYGKSMSVEELSIILVVLDNSNTFCMNFSLTVSTNELFEVLCLAFIYDNFLPNTTTNTTFISKKLNQDTHFRNQGKHGYHDAMEG